MATYNQPPNLQTYISAPYQLPVAQIAQAIDTRNRYWDLGASQFKTAYQNYLNLDLTHKSNKDSLNGLMQVVNGQLKSIVQTDLSIASNQGEAMKVFDPIVGGKTQVSQNILGDEGLTRHYKQQAQIAERFRTENEGKQYSEINVNYLMQGLDRFAKDDPSKWREHYAQRRNYTPYYDVQSEVRDLMKNFKPSQTSTTTPDIDPKTGAYKSFYLISKSDKSAYESQLNAYLGANLSDKAKTQLSINGAVSYYNNPGLLAEDYSSYNTTKINSLKNDLQALNGAIKGSSNPEFIKGARAQVIATEDAIKDLEKENSDLKSGNSEFFKRNSERIAGSIFTDKYIKNLARANQRLDVEVQYKPDMAALRWFSEDQENKRFNTKLDFDATENQLDRENRLAIARLRMKKDGSEEPQFVPSLSTSDESQNQDFNLNYLNTQFDNAKRMKEEAAERLKQEIQSMTGADLSKMTPIEREKITEQWLLENKGRNPAANDYYKKFNTANNIEKVYNDLNAYAESEVKRLYPELYTDYKKVKPISTTFTSSLGEKVNIVLNEQEATDAANGRQTKIKIYRTGSGKIKSSGLVDETYHVVYGGRDYVVSPDQAARISSSINQNAGPRSRVKSKINEILSTSISAIREEKLPVGNQEKVEAFTNLRDDMRKFGIKDAAISSVRIFSVEKEGVNFVLPPAFSVDDLGVSPEALEKNVMAMGGRKKTVDGSPVYFVPYDRLTWKPNRFSDAELNPISDYFNYRKSISINKGQTNTTIDAPPTVIYDPNNTGENIRLKMDLNSGIPEFFIVYNKKKIYDLTTGRGFTSIDQAGAFIKEYIRTKEDLDRIIKVY